MLLSRRLIAPNKSPMLILLFERFSVVIYFTSRLWIIKFNKKFKIIQFKYCAHTLITKRMIQFPRIILSFSLDHIDKRDTLA